MASQSVIADGLADLPETFLWVLISKHTCFITPKAQIYKMQFCVDQKYTLNLRFLCMSLYIKKCDLKQMSLQLFLLYFTVIFYWVSIDLFYNIRIFTFRYMC